ncbi:hypothetical protein Vafri_14438 [Volvox africanus]|uniref:Uncharacterized protein n=1 Tax=Volvox africanus TaxID=51714 RepID=A0A8J4BDH3_9CHLO|nr:hypothetical protein Vafri_14438 [Volvox africanus]
MCQSAMVRPGRLQPGRLLPRKDAAAAAVRLAWCTSSDEPVAGRLTVTLRTNFPMQSDSYGFTQMHPAAPYRGSSFMESDCHRLLLQHPIPQPPFHFVFPI